MAAIKRTHKNSVAGALDTFKTVKDVLVSPLELTQREALFFDMITQSREISTWSKSDLFNAASLAKVQRRIEELNDRLDAEGITLVNDRGTQIANPVFSAMTQLMSQAATLNRILGLSSSQRGVSGEPQKVRNVADARARDVIKKVAEEELLA